MPLFSTRPAALDVWTSGSRPVPGVLDRSGLSRSLDTIADMGALDRLDQEWIISASLAIRRPTDGHHSVTPMPGLVTGTAAPPARLLATACALADQIVARSLSNRDRVNWLGLELVDDLQWLVLPMGAGLANGYVGVALFLAQLSDLSGIARYATAARRALTGVPALFELLSGRPDLVSGIGCGGWYGLGGIAYALARLSTLLADNDIGGWAADATRLAADSADAGSERPGWAAGRAGCLAAMIAVDAELGLDAAAQLAWRCADHTAATLEGPDPLPGRFADGTAGMATALARFAVRHPDADPRFARVARTAIATAEADPARVGWCTGTAGILAARARVLGEDARMDGAPPAERPVLANLSLCHGELGISDGLCLGGADGRYRRRRAGLILDAINRYGPRCGTPGAVTTPGLFSGLAGIGYGLLRLGFPERVPSVLLLDPSSHIK